MKIIKPASSPKPISKLKIFIGFVVGIFLLLSIPILIIGIPAQFPHDFEMCMNAKGNIAQMEAGAGYYVEDWCYEEGFHKTDELNEIDGVLYEVESGEPFTGGFRIYEHNDKPLNLKDGFHFYHAYMRYENGKLNGDSVYIASCREDNMYSEDVLIERYEDGVLIEYQNVDHECYDYL